MTDHDSEEQAPMKFRDFATSIPPAEGLMQIIEPGWRSSDDASTDRSMTPKEQGGKAASEEREAIAEWLEARARERLAESDDDSGGALEYAACQIRNGAHHEEH